MKERLMCRCLPQTQTLCVIYQLLVHTVAYSRFSSIQLVSGYLIPNTVNVCDKSTINMINDTGLFYLLIIYIKLSSKKTTRVT
jgi:hypothetical protein